MELSLEFQALPMVAGPFRAMSYVDGIHFAK